MWSDTLKQDTIGPCIRTSRIRLVDRRSAQLDLEWIERRHASVYPVILPRASSVWPRGPTPAANLRDRRRRCRRHGLPFDRHVEPVNERRRPGQLMLIHHPRHHRRAGHVTNLRGHPFSWSGGEEVGKSLQVRASDPALRRLHKRITEPAEHAAQPRFGIDTVPQQCAAPVRLKLVEQGE